MILKVEPERIVEQRGGTGPASQPDPDPRTKYSPTGSLLQ
jgi:hypothetical protein